MPFYTRPNFEDRQIVQYSGTSITLSGTTNINYSGAIKAKNGGLIQVDNGGTFRIVDGAVYGYVLTSNVNGNAYWGPVSGTSSGSLIFTGNTPATCVNHFYVSNIHGCSPITVHDQFQHTGSVAGGILSVAFGSGNTASANYSHVEGESTTTDGIGSHAEGIFTWATGEYSHTEGSYTETYGYASHAEGRSTVATGNYSHAEGYQTRSWGDYSHSEGGYTYTGILGYSASTGCVNGVITLDSVYSDVTGEFVSPYVIVYDTVGLTSKGYALSGTPTLYTSTTKIYLNNTSVNIGNSVVVGIPQVTGPAHADINMYATYAHSSGESSIASGFASSAKGINTHSGGDKSSSEGRNSLALGNGSHAEGNATVALGDFSHAEGQETISSGSQSHAEGYLTTASGMYSHAEGIVTIASGDDGSHAEGSGTQALGPASHAEGKGTAAKGDYSHSEGSGASGGAQALGYASHSEGYGTIAGVSNYVGQAAHAEGINTQALADYSHAEGSGTTVTTDGLYSHAEGNGTYNAGIASHTEGWMTTIAKYADYSHVEGYGSQCLTGLASHSEGYYNYANANYSHVQNANNITTGIASHVGGSGNTSAGLASFIHSINSNMLPNPGGSVGSSNAILGGINNLITGNSISNTVILGGSGITATLTNSVYVPRLTIQVPTNLSASDEQRSAIGVRGNNTQGGTDYLDFLTVTNTVSGASKSTKYFRLNKVGSFEIVDATYSNVRLTLTDAGDLTISGALSKGSGTFRIPNPTPNKNNYIYHSFVESPTAGDNIYRWSIKIIGGKGLIDLPDYYHHLNENNQIWVNGVENFGKGYGKINGNILEIYCDTDGEYNVLLIGTRRDPIAVTNWKGVEREN